MSIHIAAKVEDIAETILLPGDPKRAKWIAENYLDDVFCYTDIRGMLGFTGTYKGKRISVQGTGMGIPSISIYITELIKDYGVKNLIRVGTAGSYQKDIKVRDLLFLCLLQLIQILIVEDSMELIFLLLLILNCLE